MHIGMYDGVSVHLYTCRYANMYSYTLPGVRACLYTGSIRFTRICIGEIAYVALTG